MLVDEGAKMAPELLIATVNVLLRKKERYLNATSNTEDYNSLNYCFENLPEFYEKYAICILRSPLQMKQPESPYSAAYRGTMLGGAAVGMVAAQRAIEKEKLYNQNRMEVISSDIQKEKAFENLKNCYWRIFNIIQNYEYPRRDWDSTVEEIVDDFIRKEDEEHPIVKNFYN